MARGFNGTTDRIDYNSIDPTGQQPQTFSSWLYVDDIPTHWEYPFCQCKSDNSTHSIAVQLSANREIVVSLRHVTAVLNKFSATNQWPVGELFHLLVTWNGGTAHSGVHIYVNNVEVSYGTSANGVGAHVAPSGFWTLGAAYWNDSVSFDGTIAEAGWWNRVLTADERAILAKSFSPRFIPNGLKFAPDLIRNQRDIITGQTGTLDGTTVRPHPPIIYPAGPQFEKSSKIIVPLAGSIAIESGMTGALKVSRKLSGLVAIESVVAGALKVSRKLSGSIAIQSGVSGILTIQKENVRWSAGLFTFQGLSYEIAAGETNKKFIYWDPNYTTMFRTTNDLQDVLNVDGWIMCIGESGVASPVFARKLIHGGIIQAGTITAEFGQIAALTVGTAEIKDLAVETLKIKDQAVTLMVAAFTASQGYYQDYSWHEAQTITMVTTGAPVALWAAVQWKNVGDDGCNIRIQRDDSVTVYSTNMWSMAQLGNPFCIAIVDDSPSAASHTYDLDIATTNVDIGDPKIWFKNRSLVGQEVKK